MPYKIQFKIPDKKLTLEAARYADMFAAFDPERHPYGKRAASCILQLLNRIEELEGLLSAIDEELEGQLETINKGGTPMPPKSRRPCKIVFDNAPREDASDAEPVSKGE